MGVVIGEGEHSVVLVTLDREMSAAVITRSDGKEAQFPLRSSPFQVTSVLSRLHWTPSGNALLAVTRAGDEVLFELPSPTPHDGLDGRVVVYLDQNKWSALSNARHDPARAHRDDRDAAEQLAEWVRQARIVMPASAGHYYETAKRFDTGKRYHLGLTILQLSRGWQMLDPLAVRRSELHSALYRHAHREDVPRDVPVITLAPNAIHSGREGASPYVASGDFPPPVRLELEALTAASGYIDAMLDAERTGEGPDTGWSTANQQFSDWLDSQRLDSQQKRKSIDVVLLADLQRDLASAANVARLSPQDLQTWLSKRAMADISELPATGLFREMLHSRHLNKGTRWVPNDLTDMIYLSCAAGYADFVVCERQMLEPLMRGLRRLKRTPQAFRSLTEAVVAIEAALSRSRAAHHDG